MSKVLITTVPFASKDKRPLKMLDEAGVDYEVNPLNKKLTEEELGHLISEYSVLIAGTEPITAKVIEAAPKLKLISRVGIGLDNVDLLKANSRGIKVSYTPDAPSPAVAELTLGLIFSLIRALHVSNHEMHKGIWHRSFGRRISDLTIGVIGVGRIGTRVLELINAVGNPRLLVNDLSLKTHLNGKMPLEWVSKERILKEADIVTVHVPLTKHTKNMIRKKELLSMKSDASIINTARGGIINEQDLHDVLRSEHLSGAAIDVFDLEPYKGPLCELDRCILTAHMGSMSVDCRNRMEYEATEEVIRFLSGERLERMVPLSEYELQSNMVLK
tara:strand:- start:29002 stop:29991 length:990 start_codon:yes stop_codon:yes gene_type:complete